MTTPGGFAGSRSAMIFKKSRALVIISIIVLSILSWGYMVSLGSHPFVNNDAGFNSHPHPSQHFIFVFVMWTVMMVAMMLPTAAPTILMHETMVRKKNRKAGRESLTFLFLSGYLSMWTVYSGFAALGQLWLQNTALISTGLAKGTPIVSGVLLITAGIFQFTSLKYACLKHCRSPMGFFMLHWREGRMGAFNMGLLSGLYCVGCCWALMVLMFVAGAMNIVWMAVLALYILVEKLIPWGRRFSQGAGAIMLLWGVGIFVIRVI